MSRYHIQKFSRKSEVIDRQIIDDEKANQVIERYHLSAKNLALLVWEYIRAYVFFEDGYHAMFEDGMLEKFEDQ